MGCCWRGCARTASWTRSGSRAPGPTERSCAASADGRGRASRTSTGRIAKARRPQGKSDPLDAEAAARAAQAGRATGIPKIGPVRSRRCARYGSPGRSAVAAPRPSADPDEVVDRHAPDPLRSQLRELLGLPAHPRRTAQARPSRRRIHNPPDPQQAADTSGTTASDPYVLATVPARAGLDLLPRRLRDHPETDLRLLRPGSRRPLRAHPGDDQTSAERGPPNWHATS
jgi:hypothetical protein